MSYDVSIMINPRNDYYYPKEEWVEVFHMNFTRNYSPMWELGCAGLGVKETLEVEGMFSILTPKYRLKALLNNLQTFKDQFKALNPSNGWGDYELLCEHVKGLIGACETWPDGYFKVSS